MVVNSDTEFGIEGVTFAENIEPGPFRKLFMIGDGRRISNGIVIIYIVIFLLFIIDRAFAASIFLSTLIGFFVIISPTFLI